MNWGQEGFWIITVHFVPDRWPPFTGPNDTTVKFLKINIRWERIFKINASPERNNAVTFDNTEKFQIKTVKPPLCQRDVPPSRTFPPTRHKTEPQCVTETTDKHPELNPILRHMWPEGLKTNPESLDRKSGLLSGLKTEAAASHGGGSEPVERVRWVNAHVTVTLL